MVVCPNQSSVNCSLAHGKELSVFEPTKEYNFDSDHEEEVDA
jgi:hypothetical protein